MNKAKEVIQLLEMSVNRGAWIYLVRKRYLGGALGEYTKLYIAKKVGIKDYWSDEIKSILLKVHEYMDEDKITVRGNRKKMLKEAMKDVTSDQYQVTDAKNEIMLMFNSKKNLIKKLGVLKSEELFPEMIKEYLTEFKDLL
jgi:hypothetical protein